MLFIKTIPYNKSTLVSTKKKNRRGEDVLKPRCVFDYYATK